MKFLRHLLFAVFLLLAQAGALSHAVEHLRLDVDEPPSHACTLCIEAQGLNAPLASAQTATPLLVADYAAPAGAFRVVFSSSYVPQRARAPPVA